MSLIEDLRNEYRRLQKKLELYQYIEDNLEDDSNEMIYRQKIYSLETRMRDIFLVIDDLENYG
jgi:hypothetical protein